uniref:hypothetical protein n=1 Tax=Streptomyces sp. bgisy060 TaxID=3413775 RepID=UPI003EBE2F35
QTVFTDWPELNLLGDETVRDLTRSYGIRHVRTIAREVQRNVSALAAPTPVHEIDAAELEEMGADDLLTVLREHAAQLPAQSTFAQAWRLLDLRLTQGGPECLPAPWDGPQAA